jgi:hypothetical protein
MKATKRNNGLMMFTVSIPVSFGFDDMVNVLASRHLHHDVVAPGRASIRKAMIRAFKSWGSDLTFEAVFLRVSDEDAGDDPEKIKEAIETATDVVSKAFPELVTKASSSGQLQGGRTDGTHPVAAVTNDRVDKIDVPANLSDLVKQELAEEPGDRWSKPIGVMVDEAMQPKD